MSNRAEGVSRVAGTDTAMVFAKTGIQNVEAAFDQPAASQQGQQQVRVRLSSGQACDRVRRRLSDVVLFQRVAFQANELFRTGPVAPVRIFVSSRKC